MFRLAATTMIVLLMLAPAIVAAGPKGDVTLTKLSDVVPHKIGSVERLSAADTCIVYEGDEIAWQIDGWVFGNELYKGYLDPGAVCGGGYPFEVWEIHIVMAFDLPTPLNISVDIEDVALLSAGCNAPGSLLVISSEYQNQVPDSGLYDIGIPLDAPFQVDGPFFGGVFIANAIDQSIGAAVTTDTIPTQCTSYNIWDETIGFVDLVNNEYYNFPGRLIIYAVGTPLGPASCCQNRGNVNGSADGAIDIADVTYLASFMFKSGAEPPCMEEANVNGSAGGSVDIADLTYLVAYMFKAGIAPVACQ